MIWKTLINISLNNTLSFTTLFFYDSSADDETCEESGGKHFDKFNPYIDVSLPQFKLLNEEWAKAA